VAGHDVTVLTVPAVPTAVIATATTWDAYPRLWPKLLEEVWGVVRTTPGAEPGRNVMLYRDDVPHVEVGVEMSGVFPGSGRVLPSVLPGGAAAHTISRGSPSVAGISAAHEAVLVWCAEHEHALTGVRWEVYGHWRDHQDPAAFETEIYWLLA
jgi:effector-binding domain-containing protein